MRFLLANNHCISDPTAGVTHSLQTIMRWLAEGGHECQILTTARFASPVTFTIEEHLSQLGVPLSRISAKQGGPKKRHAPTVHYTTDGVPVTLLLTRHNDESQPDPAEAAQYQELFNQLLHGFAPDQLIACNAHPMIQLSLATAKKHGITTVFSLRGATYYDRRYFEAVDHAFTASQFMTDLYWKSMGLISTPINSPIEWSKVIAPTESRAFLTFVDPKPRKGLMLFARLADILGSRRPDIPILVVQSSRTAGFLNNIPGIDFSKYPQIMAAPSVSTPAEYFALTRILLVPSLFEAFGRVAVEAMINAIPPIVSNRGGLSQAIGGDFSAGGGGRVLPVPNWLTTETIRLPSEEEIQPWFDAVCELWDDPILYQRMANRARQIAEERYSEHLSRQQHVNYLTSLRPGGRLFL